MSYKKYAFTLVELIVVITILAILGTIAFIAMQGYSKDARDSVRISNMSKITTSLELYHIDSGKYPDPTEAYPVTYSGSLVWYQGTFGNSTFMNVDKLDNIPVDPVTDKEYTYSLLGNKQEYQLGGISEGDEYGFHPHSSSFLREEGIKGIGQVNASEKTARALVRGTYNGMALRVNTSTTSYILAVPSIITSLDLSVEGSDNRKLDYIIEQKEIVLNGYKNLPNNYINSNYIANKEVTNEEYKIIKDNNVLNALIYQGDLINLTSEELVNKLQLAYGGTILQESGDFNELLNLRTTQLDKQEGADIFGVNFINRYLGGSAVNKIYTTCGGIAHNTTMTYYSTGSVDFGQTCESIGIDFTCIDGTWTDQETSQNITNYPETQCVVELPLGCEYLGMPLDHGDSLTVYSQPTILWNATENCIDGGIEGQVTCNNGTLDGNNTYGYLTCTKGIPSNCEEEVKVISGHSYNIPALNHAGTGAYIDEITENNGIFRYTYNAICNDGTITGTETGPENVSCNTNYTWNATTEVCEANTQIFTCGTKPSNTIWNTVGSYEQTWSGTQWLPVNSTPTYNLTSSNNECRYKCETGYYWNSSSCIAQWSGDSTSGYLFKNSSGIEVYPTSCDNLLSNTTYKNLYIGSPWNGTNFNSGVYWIKPDLNTAFKVYCDMTGQGGGWTLLSNAVSYDGTGLFTSGNSCQSINQNCGGDLSKLGVSTLGYNKVKIVHKDGKYVVFELKSGGNFEKAFKGTNVYVGSIDSAYIYEDIIHSRSGYNDVLVYWGVNNSNNSLWLANHSLSSGNWSSYAYKRISNCPNVGYTSGNLVCGNTGGFSIYVKKDSTIIGTQSNPGKSCKEIKISGTDTGDGVYRIKPDSNPAFQVYCDMTTDGGGWTLVRKMKSDVIVSGSTASSNVASLINLTTASANLSDLTWNALKPTQVWNICNGYQTIYNRNMNVAWASSYGVPNSCNYNIGFWSSLQNDFGATLYTQTLNQSCGGASNADATARGVLSGIYSTTHYGCYDGQKNTQLTSIVTSKYNNGSGNTLGWGGNGYVFVR